MTPKYRGDSDDWLEDEGKGARAPTRPAHKSSPHAGELEPGEANATVAEVFPRLAKVVLDEGGDRLCTYRRALVMGFERQLGGKPIRERSPVAVGDRVLVEATGKSDGVIQGICRRENLLARPAPDRDDRSVVHVLAANLDLLVIVSSTCQPEFSEGLVDRFLVAASAGGVPVFLCVNKLDLWQEPTRPWQIYRKIGVELWEGCAKDPASVAGLRERLDGKRVAFCGHSGVGKTSLIATLLGRTAGKVGTVNVSTGKGRHTTTGAILIRSEGATRWIDTPGIREFGLIGIGPDVLRDHFPEFRDLACQARDCRHHLEASCDARGLARHPSYLRILKALEESRANSP